VPDRECVEFLQWALPRLRLRWPGFRKVRRQVCRRVRRRSAELGLAGCAGYREYLEAQPQEWQVLDGLLHITISRFYRDRGVFDVLVHDVLPALAGDAADNRLSIWSAGCASGEEPYTLALAWNLELHDRFPEFRLRVLATDVDAAVLRRARAGCYESSSLKDLPPAWRSAGFTERSGRFCLRPEHREAVTLRRHDLRDPGIDGPFDLVLCRNLAFTYFATDLQREVRGRLAAALRPRGALVLGAHEALPEGALEFEEWSRGDGVYRRVNRPRPGRRRGRAP
jgi:chemotaxis protein methyltransferase CheR